MMMIRRSCRRMNFMFLIFCFFFGAVLIAPALVVAGDSITPRQSLVDDNGTSQLVSAGQTFILGFFGSVGKRYVGIWYYKVSVQTVVWVANRQRPITVDPGTLSIASDGTLLLTDGNTSVIWSAYGSSASLANTVAQLLDDGNLVVREASSGGASNPGSFAWQSFDYPSDTLLPGMKLGWNLTSRLNRRLTAWTNPSDPTPSQYTVSMDLHGYPEIFLWAGNTKLFRTGPWNGLRFSGIPGMKTYDKFSFDFVVNRDEVFYAFYVHDPSFITRLIVNQLGIAERLVWIEDSKIWNAFWQAPKDPCDSVSPCGPNGVCNPNDAPICDCVRGFRPKNPANWDFRDGSDGCVRKTALDCRNKTDRLFTVTGAKLPDTSSSVVDMSLSLDQCKTMCLTNCSCKACAAANISDGSSGTGCIMWIDDLTDLRVYTNGGQELYVRLAAADLGPESNNSHNASTAVIIIVVIAAALLLSGATFCVWKRKKRGRRGTAANLSLSEHYLNEENEAKDLDLPMYDLVTIMAATGNFSADNKIGEGGFGPVYKGNLGEGQEIAVKRLSRTSVQGLDEFKNEVELIAKLQHRNLVRLLGCCIQGEERMLIYEYMSHGSLDAVLFYKSKEKIFDWQTRYNIILGIARGLVYLHQDSRFRIIHRDLKASNILLDKDMNPKISDFGMARIFGGDETQVNTRRVVGTYGYMSPEYVMDGVFSVKSDVFSFGVLVLEIVSGKKNRGIYNSERQLNLLAHAWSLFRDGKGLELVSETIGFSYRMDEAMRCIKVGLLCVQERPEDRPTMPSVVLMLGNEGAMLPQPRQPGFVAMRGPLETDSSTGRPDSLSINDISLTIFEAR